MTRRVLLLTIVLLLTGCADKRIALTYTPDASAAPLIGAQPITVFAFSHALGTESDHDPSRVGGVDGGYGSRPSKVMVATPFGVLADADDGAAALNAVLARWVQKIVTDPGIAARLAAR